MIRAAYTATSGMMLESRRADLIADNLYNAEIPGFKVRRVLKAARPATDVYLPTDVQATQVGQYVVPTSGPLRTTGKPLDFALEGTGFFALQTDSGVAYTRDGRFHRSADGIIRDGNAHALVGERGVIELPRDTPADAVIRVDEVGDLFVDGELIDRIMVRDFPGYRGLQAAGGSLYYATGSQQPQPVETKVVQNTVEDSNVTTIAEMSKMIESMRAFESYQKVISTVMDDVTGEVVRRLGRVG